MGLPRRHTAIINASAALLVGPVGLELAIQHVVGDGTSSATALLTTRW
jgi:hypothetical protein